MDTLERSAKKMHELQAPYRALLEELCEADNTEILSRWLTENSAEIAWLDCIKGTGSGSVPDLATEDNWRLYALSRVSDTLIHQTERTGNSGDLELFMLGLGLEPISSLAFHPFFHELFSVAEHPDKLADIELTGEAWPGFLCGSLLIARAGVSVSAGASRLKKSVAESSTLYWAYRRSNRPTEDLSMGWGSNSQWRTSFRRDYVFDDRFEYNVDARERLDDGALTPLQQLELVRHRCFVHSEDPHDDLWPYDIRYNERRAE